MIELKDRHLNETVWIIGKGPSLQHLAKEHIGDGIVIALNQAIIKIEELNLDNPVYSMQKDGGVRRHGATEHLLTPECDFSGRCGDICGDMIKPKRATLLLHEHESKYCFPDYAPRHVINTQEFGLQENIFSLALAVELAQYMGCKRFKIVSCDVHVNGNYECYMPGEGVTHRALGYLCQRPGFTELIKGLDYEFITPGGNVVNIKKKKDLKISFGVLINDVFRFNTILKKSALPGEIHYIINPKSATKGLNTLLNEIDREGADVAVLTHQDMHYRNGWLQMVQQQLTLLPDNWVCAGIIGKELGGAMCGKFHDMRFIEPINTSEFHLFPQPACCFDECCLIINMKSGFRFDEFLDGFDLYGTLCVLQAWQMDGSAWIIDAFAEHYCMRPFTWFPDDTFKARYKGLYDRYNKQFGQPDSTVFVSKPRFETSAGLDEYEGIA